MANRIEIIIDSVTHGLESGLHKSTGGFAKFRKAALGAGLALAGGLAVGLEKSVHAAMEHQVVEARLAQAFKTSGLNASKYHAKVEELAASSRKLGFTDEDVDNSLGSLLIATHNMAAASKDLSTAQDIARFKHIQLSDATKMLTMAMTGSQRAAKQLGISVQPVTTNFDALAKNADKAAKAHARFLDKQATGQATIDAVNAKLHGQAEAFAQTAAGGMEQFKAQLNALEVSLGTLLLPAVAAVSAELAKFAAYLTKHKTLAKALVIGIGALSVALIAAAAAQMLLNLAVLANPYVAATVAVIALGVAIYVFRGKIIATFDWIKAHWPLLVGILGGPIAFAVAQIIVHFGAIRSAAASVVSSIIAQFNRIKSGLSSALSSLGAIAQRALAPVARAFETIYGWVAATIHAVEGLISAIGRIHVPSIHLPHVGILGHAMGGSVSGNSASIVGEKGPELFVPRSAGSIIPNSRLGGGGGATYVFNFPNYVGDKRELMSVIRNEAQLIQQRTGRPAF